MKNGDLPANPIFNSDGLSSNEHAFVPDGLGLTKREDFAKAALEGLCSNGEFLAAIGDGISEEKRTQAVGFAALEMADGLLIALEAT